MNKDRRKEINSIIEQMSSTAGLDDLDGLGDQIEAVLDEERDYFDNMPESLQGGEKGDAANEAIEHLERAKDAVMQMSDSFTEALDALRDAAN